MFDRFYTFSPNVTRSIYSIPTPAPHPWLDPGLSLLWPQGLGGTMILSMSIEIDNLKLI